MADQHPIFEKFSLSYLEDRGLGTKVYLALMEAGQRPLRPGFRRKAARLLHLTEADLFIGGDLSDGR